ncbi:MAG TPA: hypothetical protein PKD24_14580 [Pyrinomonadaceae bacterium]|nr:hypothetical protein [Pyrinomonadaceae bacterium]HMP66600.1 hypothetical protein [Pyrinomonadaceae bacterium]
MRSRKLWRDYSPKPFTSGEWRAGAGKDKEYDPTERESKLTRSIR